MRATASRKIFKETQASVSAAVRALVIARLSGKTIRIEDAEGELVMAWHWYRDAQRKLRARSKTVK